MGLSLVAGIFLPLQKKGCFTHTPVSPYNSKANGKVESAVKMAKNLFRKAREDKADPYLAMLDHRNTPAKGLLSPAQKLMSRRTKTLLPTREDLLKLELPKNLKKLVKRDSRRQERPFNHEKNPLQPLHTGDVMRMKPHTNGQKEWKKAIVWRRLVERSYHVKVAGELYRQNRVDLKKTAEAPPLTSLIHHPYEVQGKVPENEGRGTEETCNTEPTQDESEIRERLNPTPSPTKLSPKRARKTPWPSR